MIKFLLLLNIAYSCIYADYFDSFIDYKKRYLTVDTQNIDQYTLFYNHQESRCTLKKNTKEIALFDERYESKKKPFSPYTCTAWIKENYSTCKVVDRLRISAQSLSFGNYEKTNLIIAFIADYHKLDSYIDIECQK